MPTTSNPKTSLSIIIVNHNSGKGLRQCLQSIPQGLYEVVVINNCSTDGSLEGCAEKCDRVVWAPRPQGFAANNNLGVTAAHTSFLLFLNPDTRVFPGSLLALLAAARQEGVGVVGARLIDGNGQTEPSWGKFPSPLSLLVDRLPNWGGWHRWAHHQQWREGNEDMEEPLEADWVSGACLLVRREALQQVGGWDESYPLYYEDVDLCWRIRQAGWRVRWVPQAVVYHQRGGCAIPEPAVRRRLMHDGQWRFMQQRYPDLAGELWCCGFILFLWLLAWGVPYLRDHLQSF